ncbi:MAG: DUF4197 family protein [Saprospiraceae bacterium]|nr:DUF4197 family protein [Saprospiraceae bacterium]
MKKLLLLFVILGMTGSGIYAQDSLTAGEKQLLVLFGTIFSEAKHKIIEDSRTNGNKSIMGNALLETMKGLANRTKDQILTSGPDASWVNLPDLLQQKKEVLISRGKANLLQNFKSSIEQAAINALNNSLLAMVDQLTEIDPQSLVTVTTAQSVSITDIFYNSNKSKMVNAVKPVAKAAFKLSGGKKLYNKIENEIKKSGGPKLNIDNTEFLATAATEYFFKMLKQEETGIKKNPLRALDSLIDVLFPQKGDNTNCFFLIFTPTPDRRPIRHFN